MKITPTLLLILDGWGIAPEGSGNAVRLAHTPHLDALLAKGDVTALACSGRAVGLPDGFMGNSEVGHMNIGAGRVIYQDMTRIDMAIEDGSLFQNPVLIELMDAIRSSGGRLHLMGLLSDGGVHSHERHLAALIKMGRKAGLEVVIHAFLDGRDTSPTSGVGFVGRLLDSIAGDAHVQLGSMIGRYYAMDRDQRWERNQLAWEALTQGKGQLVVDAVAALEAAYAEGETDEFIKPRLVLHEGKPSGVIQDGDGVFFYNFRADRARQLTSLFVNHDFDVFDRGHVPNLAGFATMTQYDSKLPVPVAFLRQSLEGTLGEVVAELDLKQLRIAETEKYAHVTYFFNCGREEPLKGEDRILLPSPRDVATYDLKPGMSAEAVTDALVEAWNSNTYSLVVCNLANLDMVGHTGIIPAAIEACEVVDACVGRIADAVLESGGRLIVTADHGNAEELLDAAHQPQTAHSLNLVPFVLMEKGHHFTMRSDGKLGDIAPTILGLWGVALPDAMTGVSLVEEIH